MYGVHTGMAVYARTLEEGTREQEMIVIAGGIITNQDIMRSPKQTSSPATSVGVQCTPAPHDVCVRTYVCMYVELTHTEWRVP